MDRCGARVHQTRPEPVNLNHQVELLMRFIFTTILITLINAHNALADAPERPVGSLTISEVSASAGELGGSSIVRLLIQNDGATAISFLGVSSPIAMHSKLMGRISATGSTAFESIVIPADGTLDLNSSHLWVTLTPIHKAFLPGEKIPLTIRFVEGDISVMAHVH